MFDREAFDVERLDEEARRELLGAYLDDELSPEAARHVTAWLEAHPDALREVEHLRRVWDLLALYEDEPVPEGFATSVVAQAGIRPRAPRGRAGRLLVLPRPAVFAAAAAVLLLGLAGGLWLAGGMASAPRPSPEGEAVAEAVPVEYLEEVDVLLALSDDEFRAYLLADLEEPWGDGS